MPLFYSIFVVALLYFALRSTLSPYVDLLPILFNDVSHDDENTISSVYSDTSTSFVEESLFTESEVSEQSSVSEESSVVSAVSEEPSKPEESSAEEVSEPEQTYPIDNSVIKASTIKYPTVGLQYGKITFNRINYSVKLFYGDNMTILRSGAGQYTGSSLPGFGSTILVAGHNTSYFLRLGEIRNGDIITVSTFYGTFYYRVYDMQVRKLDDATAYDLVSKRELLVLYTCYPLNSFGYKTQRYFVYAEKVSGPTVNLYE